jgi:hypothetical protein
MQPHQFKRQSAAFPICLHQEGATVCGEKYNHIVHLEWEDQQTRWRENPQNHDFRSLGMHQVQTGDKFECLKCGCLVFDWQKHRHVCI